MIILEEVTLVNLMVLQEQFYIMKANEVMTRAFKLYPASDQAAKYVCSGRILMRRA